MFLVSPFLLPYSDSILVDQLLTMTLPLAGFLIPHLLGGAVVGSALESEARKNEV